MRELQRKALLGTRDQKRGRDHQEGTTIIVIMQNLIRGTEGRLITIDKEETGRRASEVEDLETDLRLVPYTDIGAGVGQEIDFLDVVDLLGVGPR